MRPLRGARGDRAASRVSWAPFVILMTLAGLCALMTIPMQAHADTVRLKDGRTVEGKVLQSDASAVVVLVGSQPQFFAHSEVEAIHYSGLRFSPPTTSVSSAPGFGEPLRIDYTVLEDIGVRLRMSEGLMRRAVPIRAEVRRGHDPEAIQGAHRAVEGLLPLHRGRFSPFYVLADLLILLGLRGPTVWLALLLVKEPRSFQRIAEFLVVAYGLTMLFMTLTLDIAYLWITLCALPLVFGTLACLFAWMFALPFRRAVAAFLVAVAFNLGVEVFLTSVHLL